MRKYSIITKIMGIVLGVFLFTACVFVFLTHFHLKEILDSTQRAVYQEKLNTIFKILDSQLARLKSTQMRSAYEEAFQDATIKTLRRNYYDSEKNQRIYPFIVSKNGSYMMHPVLPRGEKFIRGEAAIVKSLDFEGELNYTFLGEKKWFIYRHFPEWNWVVAYTMPSENKYLSARLLRNKLALTMGLIVILAMITISIIIARMIRPVKTLTKVSRAMAEGDLEQTIDTSGNDEIGSLSRSFSHMRDTIHAKIKDLTESEELFRLLAQVSPVGIFRTDVKGNIIYVNEKWCEFAGITCEYAMGDIWTNTIHPSDRREIFEEWSSCVKERGTFKAEYRSIGSVDKEVWFFGQAMPETDEDGHLKGYVGAVTDITNIKKLEGQLQQAQKMEAIGTLAGGIAHDFNNILTPILGFADIVKMGLPKGSEIWNHQQEVIKAARRAADLVKQILAFSRLSENERKPLQINLIVKEALKLLRASIPTTIEIHEDINNSGTVIADPTEIHQIMMNLCTNSYHAMRETGGILSVELLQVKVDRDDSLNLTPGPYLVIKVSDTGKGMDSFTMGRIFEPYFTTKKKGEGTGMGLAVAHGIVKSHGGDIIVYSEPGEGTSFQIYLPQVTTQNIDLKEEPEEELPTGNERILLIDDEETILMVEKEILKKLGYTVTGFSDSDEAFRTFSNQPENYDLIITDMTMPHMDGSQLSRSILSIRPDIPIIMYTGFSELMDRDKAMAIGIKEYLMKPIVVNDLAKSVRKVLDEN
jgi:PAS domain S-box-containing protein